MSYSFDTLNVDSIDSESALGLDIGITNPTSLTIGKLGAPVNIIGSLQAGDITVTGGFTGLTPASVGLGDVQNIKNNFTATTDPSANDDSYSIGSVWINISSDLSYTCVDNTSSAAVWQLTSYIDTNGITALTTAEVNQLSNIDSSTISSTQWGYLGATDQPLGDTISFAGLTVDSLTFNTDTITSSGDININPTGQVLMGVEPVSDTSIATKGYVDSLVQGMDTKASVRAATTGNLTATAAGSGLGKTLTGGTTLVADISDFDGVSLIVGDRVAVVLQTLTVDNGIYTVTSDNPWVLTRATDADGTAPNEVSSGLFCHVIEGTINTGTGYVLTTNFDPFTVDTNNWVFNIMVNNSSDGGVFKIDGPSVDNTVTRYSGNNDGSIQNSGVIINDTGDITGVLNMTVNEITSTLGQPAFIPGSENIFAGILSGDSITTGTNNTFYGWNNTAAVTEGSNNTIFGAGSSGITTGNNNTFIGYNSFGLGTQNNQTSIGYLADCNAANQVTLGDGGSFSMSIDDIRCGGNANLGSITHEFKDLYMNGEVKLSSTTNAFTPNKLTTIQRDTLTPVSGNTIYNTDTNTMEYYNGTIWSNTTLNAGLETLQVDDSLTEINGSFSNAYYGGCSATDGKIYCAPSSSTAVLIIDPATDTLDTTTITGLSVDNNKWSGAVAAPNGKVYMIPFDSNDILIIDTTTSPVSTNLVDSERTISSKYIGGVLYTDGKIYCIPQSETLVLVIDTLLPESDPNFVTTFGTTLSGSWNSGVLHPNGKIYGIPGSGTMLIIDPVAGTTTTTTGTPAIPSSLSFWFGGVLAPNGKIYCVPTSSDNILVFNPIDDSAELISTGLTGLKCYGGVLAQNGKIYCSPYSSGIILIINTVDNTIDITSLSGLQTTNNFHRGVVMGANGVIYSVPEISSRVYRIVPSNALELVSRSRVLSLHHNKF